MLFERWILPVFRVLQYLLVNVFRILINNLHNNFMSFSNIYITICNSAVAAVIVV